MCGVCGDVYGVCVVVYMVCVVMCVVVCGVICVWWYVCDGGGDEVNVMM